jgi:hypothetical protein
MSMHKGLNTKSYLAGGLTIGAVVVVMLLVLWRGCSSEHGGAHSTERKAYFTIDDGKSYFEESLTRIPPFLFHGKMAYRVRVVQCGNGQPYISHLEKYSEQAKQRLEERLKDPKTAPIIDGFLQPANEPGILVKKPLTGDKGWVPFSPATVKEYDAIVKITCPDGTSPRTVLPR